MCLFLVCFLSSLECWRNNFLKIRKHKQIDLFLYLPTTLNIDGPRNVNVGSRNYSSEMLSSLLNAMQLKGKQNLPLTVGAIFPPAVSASLHQSQVEKYWGNQVPSHLVLLHVRAPQHI